jgi:pyridoxine 5-phosphate synthase
MRLAINIDHIATLRNARGGTVPDTVRAALICEKAGAAGIVCHLREDRRHMRDDDVYRLREEISTKLDLEMAATPDILGIAQKVVPDLCTFVPEKRRELTTEGGLDVVRQRIKIRRAISMMHEKGIAVSLFVDPARDQIEASKEAGADMIEIHTGEYADAKNAVEQRRHLRKIAAIASFARSLELGVNAGHGLNYTNIRPIAGIKEIEEVSIGHAIIVEAMETGLFAAVKRMHRLVR